MNSEKMLVTRETLRSVSPYFPRPIDSVKQENASEYISNQWNVLFE